MHKNADLIALLQFHLAEKQTNVIPNPGVKGVAHIGMVVCNPPELIPNILMGGLLEDVVTLGWSFLKLQ